MEISDARPLVLAWAPTGRDGRVIQQLLAEAGFAIDVCFSLENLVTRLDPAYAAVVAHEALLQADQSELAEWVASQPSWSDFPFILLGHRGGSVDLDLLKALGNATVVERPVHQNTLISTVTAAVRTRRRQFHAGAQLQEQVRIQKALAEEKRALAILNALAVRMASELEFARIVELITAAGVELTGAEFAAYIPSQFEGSVGRDKLLSAKIEMHGSFPAFPIAPQAHGSPTGLAGQPIARSDDVTTDPRYVGARLQDGEPGRRPLVRSYLGVPIVSRDGQTVGVVQFGHSKPGVFTEAAEKSLAGVAGHAAVVLDNIRLYQAAQSELEERRRAEEALKQRGDELYALADNIPSLCWAAYADGRVYWFNRRWFEYTGASDQAIFTWESFIQPTALPEVQKRWRLSIETGERFEMVFDLRGQDGVFRPFLTRGVPIRNDHDKIVRWFGTSVDISGQRAIEAGLEARVAERTADLEQALESLRKEVVERERVEDALRQSQKLEAIGQLTGGVAHDFNNLLMVIRSSVDLLRRRDLPEDRRQRYLNAIAETAERGAKLTAQLLAFARRQPLKAEAFDAAEKISHLVDMLRSIVGARIAITTNFEISRAFVRADLVQFETALINMAINARDAMDGEGRITISLSRSSSTPRGAGRAHHAGQFVQITISDTGAGIAPESLSRIFEPFFTTKDVGKGTGLGLSQVYGFAKQSGGDVQVKSAVGEGTTFTLLLPAVAAPPPLPHLASASVAGSSPHGARVLVVEDNPEVGEHASQLLRDLGYEPTLVFDVASALSAIEARRADFDLVFSDVVMPGGMSGLDLKRELATRHSDLPVILTSGYSDALLEHDLENINLLQKPYSVEAMSSMFRRVLRSKAVAKR